jgi:geranylgeranyl diphosphate synthase type I
MLGLAGEVPSGERGVRRAAARKGGGYTVEGPRVIGAALAGAAPDVHTALVRFGAPLGEAFQLRDDLADTDAAPEVTPSLVDRLVDEALHALDTAPLDPTAASALRALAASLRPA